MLCIVLYTLFSCCCSPLAVDAAPSSRGRHNTLPTRPLPGPCVCARAFVPRRTHLCCTLHTGRRSTCCPTPSCGTRSPHAKQLGAQHTGHVAASWQARGATSTTSTTSSSTAGTCWCAPTTGRQTPCTPHLQAAPDPHHHQPASHHQQPPWVSAMAPPVSPLRRLSLLSGAATVGSTGRTCLVGCKPTTCDGNRAEMLTDIAAGLGAL